MFISIKLKLDGSSQSEVTKTQFDGENLITSVYVEYPIGFDEYDFRVDLSHSNGTKTFVLGNEFKLPKSMLKEGSITLQAIAYKGDEIVKWRPNAIRVFNSLNVLEDDTTIDDSIAQILLNIIDTKQDKIVTQGATWKELDLLLDGLKE